MGVPVARIASNARAFDSRQGELGSIGSLAHRSLLEMAGLVTDNNNGHIHGVRRGDGVGNSGTVVTHHLAALGVGDRTLVQALTYRGQYGRHLHDVGRLAEMDRYEVVLEAVVAEQRHDLISVGADDRDSPYPTGSSGKVPSLVGDVTERAATSVASSRSSGSSMTMASTST